MNATPQLNEAAHGGCSASPCSEFAGIQALARIREALGDPCGKLMQDELVEKVLNLVQGEKELREGVIQYIKRREDDGEDECVDELKYLLDYTQWWDWDIDTHNFGFNPKLFKTEDAARKSKICVCGKPMNAGLRPQDEGGPVCWDCFKYRTDVTPYKYFRGSYDEWVKRLPNSQAQPRQ